VTKRFFGQGEQISGTNYFFTWDHLGSVREMTDSSGSIRARYDYDPYGRKTKVSGSLESDFGFTGHYYHAVSGLCLTLFRAYDPDTGRWINRDPIEEPGGINLYDYVLNDPVNAVDEVGYSGFWGNLGRCAAQHYGFGDDGSAAVATASMLVRGGVGALALPLYKPWLGLPVLGNASRFTNPLSYAGLQRFPNLKVPFRLFRTNRLFGLLGRANLVVGLAFLTYDISSIAGCVAGSQSD
jgi:RHS repeat-associated protein